MTDFSSAYVAMCDCQEIQSRWALVAGDIAYNRKEGNYRTVFSFQRSTQGDRWYITDIGYLSAECGFIWLPSIANLSNMLGGSERQSLHLVSTFMDGEPEGAVETVEQMFLRAFMFQVNFKKWRDGKWLHCA